MTSGIKNSLCGLQFCASIMPKNIINPEEINNACLLYLQLYVCIYIAVEPVSVVLDLLPQWSSSAAIEYLLKAGNLKDRVITWVSQSPSACDRTREGPVMFTSSVDS